MGTRGAGFAVSQCTVAIRGTKLKALGAFGSYEHIEVEADWLTPRTVRPVMSHIRRFHPTLTVMCLNNTWFAGYERISRVMRRLPGEHKFVATYTRGWRRWRHVDFVDGSGVVRWLVNSLVLAFYPFVAVYLLIKPSRPRYPADPDSRPIPGAPA